MRISLCACKINQCSISTPEYITNNFFLLLLFLVLLVCKIEREKKEDIKQINESIPLDGSGGDGGGSSKNNNKWIQRYSSRYTHTHIPCDVFVYLLRLFFLIVCEASSL